jgi:hypothetical protein
MCGYVLSPERGSVAAKDQNKPRDANQDLKGRDLKSDSRLGQESDLSLEGSIDTTLLDSDNKGNERESGVLKNNPRTRTKTLFSGTGSNGKRDLLETKGDIDDNPLREFLIDESADLLVEGDKDLFHDDVNRHKKNLVDPASEELEALPLDIPVREEKRTKDAGQTKDAGEEVSSAWINAATMDFSSPLPSKASSSPTASTLKTPISAASTDKISLKSEPVREPEKAKVSEQIAKSLEPPSESDSEALSRRTGGRFLFRRSRESIAPGSKEVLREDPAKSLSVNKPLVTKPEEKPLPKENLVATKVSVPTTITPVPLPIEEPLLEEEVLYGEDEVDTEPEVKVEQKIESKEVLTPPEEVIDVKETISSSNDVSPIQSEPLFEREVLEAAELESDEDDELEEVEPEKAATFEELDEEEDIEVYPEILEAKIEEPVEEEPVRELVQESRVYQEREPERISTPLSEEIEEEIIADSDDAVEGESSISSEVVDQDIEVVNENVEEVVVDMGEGALEQGVVKGHSGWISPATLEDDTERLNENEVRSNQSADKLKIIDKEAVERHANMSEIEDTDNDELAGWLVAFGKSGVDAIDLRIGKRFVSRELLRGSELIINHSSISTPHAMLKVTRLEHEKNGDPAGMRVKVQDLLTPSGISICKAKRIRPGARPKSADWSRHEEEVVLGSGDWVKFGEVQYLVWLLPDFIEE